MHDFFSLPLILSVDGLCFFSAEVHMKIWLEISRCFFVSTKHCVRGKGRGSL